MRDVPTVVEALVGFEAAMAELAALYTRARALTALREAADAQWLPRLESLGRQLRRWRRAGSLDAEALDAACREIASLRAVWQAQIAGVRDAPDCRAVREAVLAGDQTAVRDAVPRLLAGYRAVGPRASLYVPVPVSTGRRRPGTSPFVSAAEAAERVAAMVRDGIVPAALDPDLDLPGVAGAAEPGLLDSPVAVLAEPEAAGLVVFGEEGRARRCVFTAAPVPVASVWLAPEAGDEWWEAHETPYPAFRDAVRADLAGRGLRVAAR